MGRIHKFLVVVLLLILSQLLDTSAYGQQGVVGKMGFGVNGNLNFPVFNLRDRFTSTETWGVFLTYARGFQSTVEVEYHRSRFENGKLEESTFFWPQNDSETWRRIKSPLAHNIMTINSFTVNGLYHFIERTARSESKTQPWFSAGPYLVYGAGLYHYTNAVSGLIYPGQPDLGNGIDETLLLDPFEDTDVAWGLNIGWGIEMLINENAGFDIRGRYHILIGELRELQAFNMARVYSMHYLDFGVAMKYYIGR